jgi:hypothetical protein
LATRASRKFCGSWVRRPAPAAGGLDVERDWNDALALGELQALSFARVLLAAPRFAVLDRPMTLLGAELASRVLDLLAAKSITAITFAADGALAAQHDARLELAVTGTWTWRTSAEEGGFDLTNEKYLCTSVTHDRRPCDSRRFGWSRFCWYHQPWPEVGIATVIALFIGVNATWWIAVRGGEFTRELAESLGGSLVPRFDLPNLHSGDRVVIGSVSYDEVSHRVLTLGDSDYEIDRSAEGAFHLSGEIRDPGGKSVVAELRNSRLFVSPGVRYDMNADSSAIEVVDPDLRPVLQFARDESGLVGWVGTYQKSGEVLLCGNPCAAISEKEALPLLEQQRRIFQYPGYLHPGAREH